MAKNPRRPNTAASVCQAVAKYGLCARIVSKPDGTVEFDISKPGTASTQNLTEETSENLRKLL
jgi:hypothetical protein